MQDRMRKNIPVQPAGPELLPGRMPPRNRIVPIGPARRFLKRAEQQMQRSGDDHREGGIVFGTLARRHLQDLQMGQAVHPGPEEIRPADGAVRVDVFQRAGHKPRGDDGVIAEHRPVGVARYRREDSELAVFNHRVRGS